MPGGSFVLEDFIDFEVGVDSGHFVVELFVLGINGTDVEEGITEDLGAAADGGGGSEAAAVGMALVDVVDMESRTLGILWRLLRARVKEEARN